jgi:quercetin dioxygenase-like cupin family protein
VVIDNVELTQLTNLDDIPWAELHRPWGLVRMKLVSVSLAANSFVNIIEYQAGTKLMTHYHAGPVHAYTMSGRWRYLEYDWVAGPNSYVCELPGGKHTLYCEETMQALFVTQGAFIYFDDEDRVTAFADASTMLADVKAALVAQGLSLPAGVLKS